MHIHLPKPLHGWREFAGEVGIIVIGVLLALAAEQVVEAIHWHGEVVDARAALKSELDHDLGTIAFYQAHQACISRRMDDFEAFDRSWRAGRPMHLTGTIGGLRTYSVHSNAWEIVKTGQAASHMPLRQKLDYAQIYDVLANLSIGLAQARTAWTELDEFTHSQTMDDTRLSRLEVDMELFRRIPHGIDENLAEIGPAIQRLGLRADQLSDYGTAADRECSSILPTGEGPAQGSGAAHR